MLFTYIYNTIFSKLSTSNWLLLLLTLLLAVTVLKTVQDWLKFRGKNLPPKTWSIPILGNVSMFTGDMYDNLMKLGNKHGDVFRINVAGIQAVVLNSYDAIKQAYVVQGKQFSGVPKAHNVQQWLTDNSGIFQVDGEIWQVDRRFILQTFRDFGLGKRVMETKVQSVALDLLHFLQKKNGRPCNVSPLLYYCTTNVLCSLMFDKQYDLEDPEFDKIQKNSNALLKNLSGLQGFIPAGRFICLLPNYWKLRNVRASMMKLSKRFIKEHEDVLSMDSPRDYAEAYLQRMHQLETNKSNERAYFSKKQLIGNSINFLIAGIDTTAVTILWMLWLMILHPEMQEKIWKEIESTVGTEQLPDFEQRDQMPFFEAFIMETQRYADVIPVGPFHRTTEETTVKGFTIPKDTTIIANLWSVHKDRKYWKDPETFNPYRFLNESGMVAKNEAFVPFSIGKRVCVGESLARMEIFMFTAGILQKFVLKAPDGVDLSKVGTSGGFFRILQPFELCAVPRT